MEELPGTADEVGQNVDKIVNETEQETSFIEASGEGVQTDITLEDIGDLNLRELRGLDRELQTRNGEQRLNLARLRELDEQIKQAKNGLEFAANDEAQELINGRLRDLYIERSARLEAARTNDRQIRNQINRIKETIHKMFNEDTTLRKNINTLFREQGITVVSILAAMSLAISTLVSSIVAGVRGAGTITPGPKPGHQPGPEPTPDTPSEPTKGGVQEWIKKQLEHIANVLKKLGIAALGALPGIIGSVVNWLLGVLSNTASWLAEHVWALVVGVGALLLFE